MAVKKDFSALRASGARIVTAVGYTAAAIELSSRAMVVAAARLKHGENKSKAQTQELIANILKQVKLNDDEVTVLTVTSKSTDLPDEFVPIETVPGAMDIGPNQLTLADINMDIKEL